MNSDKYIDKARGKRLKIKDFEWVLEKYPEKVSLSDMVVWFEENDEYAKDLNSYIWDCPSVLVIEGKCEAKWNCSLTEWETYCGDQMKLSTIVA